MLGVAHVLGVGGEARRQRLACCLGGVAQRVERRPRPLRIHVVGGDGGHSTPVVDPRRDQRAELVGVGEVRWRLEMHVRAEQQTGGGDGPEQLVAIARVVAPHRRTRFGQEVLDDHFLHVAVALVRVADGDERVEPLGARLADPHEDPGGERDRGAAGGLERGQPAFGCLVGRSRVRAAGFREPGRERLDHHSLRRRHRAEPFQLLPRQGARVGMREEPGLLQHRRARGDQVVDGGCVAVSGEPLCGDGVAVLRRLAECEQGFVAPQCRALAGDGENLVERQVRALEVRRRLGERAVTATVAAEHRERDEHLRREGHAAAVGSVAQPRRLDHHVVQRGVEEFGSIHGSRA